MLGMSHEEIETALSEWFDNNQDKVAEHIQGFNTVGQNDDDVMELVSKTMASVGTSIAMSAITDILYQNNKLLTRQINELICEKLSAAQIDTKR